MDCAAVKPRMEALINGSLPASERELAEQHIAMCEGCRLELELVRAIGSQDKAPGVGKDDWTLDRIFGAEGAPAKREAPPGTDPSSASSARTPLAPPGTESPPFPAASPPASPFAPGSGAASGPDAVTGMPESIADPTPFASAMKPRPQPAPAMPDPSAESSGVAKNKGGAKTDAPTSRQKRSAPSWDFEPADARADAKVPEESLFFATEALTRRKEPEVHKGSSFRVLIWGIGGLIGAILLAFSSWFVLHMSSSDDGGAKKEPDFNLEEPENPGTTQPPPPANGTQPGQASDEPDQTAQTAPAPTAPDASTNPGASGSTSPSTSSGTSNPAPHPVTRSSTSGVSPFTNPAPTGSSPPSGTTAPRPSGGVHRSAIRSTANPSDAGSQRAADAGRTVESGPGSATETRSHRLNPEAVKHSPRTSTRPPDEGEDSHIFGITPTPSSYHETKDEDLAPQPPSAASTTSPPAITHKVPPPEPAKPAQESPPAPAPPPAPDTPIQRLHLATVASAERGDLEDLRRLRTAWKEYMSRVVGPDRSRARREYADCLWAIQNLTGKRGDQKETLAAYRDYLLSAPAGEADNRSASRLRQLEEALTEKR